MWKLWQLFLNSVHLMSLDCVWVYTKPLYEICSVVPGLCMNGSVWLGGFMVSSWPVHGWVSVSGRYHCVHLACAWMGQCDWEVLWCHPGLCMDESVWLRGIRVVPRLCMDESVWLGGVRVFTWTVHVWVIVSGRYHDVHLACACMSQCIWEVSWCSPGLCMDEAVYLGGIMVFTWPVHVWVSVSCRCHGVYPSYACMGQCDSEVWGCLPGQYIDGQYIWGGIRVLSRLCMNESVWLGGVRVFTWPVHEWVSVIGRCYGVFLACTWMSQCIWESIMVFIWPVHEWVSVTGRCEVFIQAVHEYVSVTGRCQRVYPCCAWMGQCDWEVWGCLSRLCMNASVWLGGVRCLSRLCMNT